MSDESVPKSEPKPATPKVPYALALATPVLAAALTPIIPLLSDGLVRTLLAVNSFTLPLICFFLIWRCQDLAGRRKLHGYGLLLVNAVLFLGLAWDGKILWANLFRN